MKNFYLKLIKTVAITFVVLYACLTYVEQQIKLDSYEDEKIQYAKLIQEQNVITEQLKQEKAEISSPEYIEEVAREKLGLVMPYETVFIDANL